MPFHRQPRAIAPAGTQLRDTLDATADGQTLHGLGGGDLLRSTFDRTSLFGGAGWDRLVTTLSFGDRAAVLARQSGGIGNDILAARAQADSSPDVKVEVFQDGGAGDDRITARTRAAGVEGRTEAINTADGGSGHDVIDLFAGTDGAPGQSFATNIVSAGNGNDRIKAVADGDFSGLDSYSTNRIDAGAGDDRIEAVASVNSNGGFHALNDIQGGSGNDTIIATARAGSNDSGEIAQNIVDGGDGDDSIEVNTSASTGFAEVRAAVSAGAGDDVVVADSAIGFNYGARAAVGLDGGAGDDRIESSISAAAGMGLVRITNRVEGEDGNDRLVARLQTPAPSDDWPSPQVAAVNRLDGGSGDDGMTGIVDGLGRSVLDGGSGSDGLRVEGGQNNLLSGGSGLDRLFAGSGTDRLLGGSSADDFVFDLSKDQGADRILDFEGDRDRLCFGGLADEGAAGLADDLDAITTVVDQGAGLDVVVTFDSGTVLTFEGCGLGSGFIGEPLIDSLADLVEDARTQLVVEPL